MNFIVDDIDATVKKLAGKKVRAEQYDMPGMKAGPDGIWRNQDKTMGPRAMAWIKDPDAHIIGVLQQ